MAGFFPDYCLLTVYVNRSLPLLYPRRPCDAFHIT
jgi:hypothetical protein